VHGEPLDHEIKFLLPACAAAGAAALLAGCARRDREHPESVVDSIYFDTPALASLEAKRASDYRKSKLRLRWYDGGGTVWLELKRRAGSRRAKRRIALDLDGAELARAGLAARALVAPVRLLAALAEPLPAALRPVAHLRYRRSRFVDPGSGARLALDREIACLELDARAAPGVRPRALAVAVVETKGGERELPPALAALAALGARRASFSKYAACFAPEEARA
jgi:hypothetical protein